jgi:hypothetical protein
VLEFLFPFHPNPTKPKCKKLKIDLLNKKIKTLRIGAWDWGGIRMKILAFSLF